MKRLRFYVVPLMMLASPVSANGVFTTGQFRAPCTSPSDKICEYSLDIQMAFTETSVGDKKITEIDGKVLIIYGVRACRWQDTPLKGVVAADGSTRWRSEKNPVAGCGSLVFEGRKEGDSFVGVFPRFQGVRVDLTLRPK